MLSISSRLAAMTLMARCATEADIERTDIGVAGQDEIFRWIENNSRGRIVSWVLAFQVGCSLRLRHAECEPQTTWIDYTTGGICHVISGSISIFDEWFSRSQIEATQKAFVMLGCSTVPETPNEVNISKLNTAFRRISLRSKWVSSVGDAGLNEGEPAAPLASLHIAMEIIRAHVRRISRVRQMGSDDRISPLDVLILREIKGDEDGSKKLTADELVNLNSRLEEYLITLMKLKTTGLELIAENQESSIYSRLGISASASDAEVRRAYKTLAMQLHPDKGGDTELFQQLTDAYERILEKRGISKATNSQDTTEADEEKVTGVRQPEKRETVSSAEHSKPSKTETEPFLSKIIKSAEECVRSAKITSKLTSQIISLLEEGKACEDSEVKALLTMVIKSVRICGYACLDTSSAALETARNVSESVTTTDKISAVTLLASDVMNKGFDALNFMDLSDSDLIKSVTGIATRAVENARLATKLARAVETLSLADNDADPEIHSPSAEIDDPINAAMKQKVFNVEILRKLNQELIDQQNELLNILPNEFPSYLVQNYEWVRRVFDDLISYAIKQTEQVYRSSVLIRTVEQIIDVFKGNCLLFKLNEELAISTDPLNRLCRLILLLTPENVIHQIEEKVVPALASMALQRNRFLNEQDATGRIRSLLDIGKRTRMRVKRSYSPFKLPSLSF